MAISKKVKEQIAELLMSDSRRSFRAIAKELNISTTTVSRVVKELEDAGVILGYNTIIDWHKLGYDSTLCLQINVTSDGNVDTIGTQLRDIPAIKQVFYTTGDATFSAYAVCKNTEEAAALLEKMRKLSGIERIVPHTVLKTF